MRYLYLIVLILGVFNTSSAAAVAYDEAVDGDLPGWEQFAQPFPIFTVVNFDSGLNDVVGTTPWRFDSSDPSDAVQFIVGANESLQISLSETIIGNSFSEKVAWVWELIKDPLDPFEEARIAYHISNSDPGHGIPNTSLPTSLDGLVIGPGEYILYNNFRLSDPANHPPAFDPDALHLDYTIEFNVATVPIPVSVALLVPALFLIGAKRRSA